MKASLLRLVGGVAVAALASAPAGASEALDLAIEAGDEAWSRRAEGQSDGRAAAAPIAEAIAAYEEALALAPASEEARWKLMRALYYQGEHVAEAKEAQLDLFGRGRDLGEEGIDRLAAAVGGRKKLWAADSDTLREAFADPTQAAEVMFWSAVNTGVWGRTRGKLASAREGVASRIRDYATAVVTLDPSIENGGGHRVLGRLHSEAPKIPFITGWIDRDRAVAELEKCLAMAPDDLTTHLYLGEALVRFTPQRREEGLRMLRELVEATPNPAFLVEELKAISDARALLEQHDG